MWSRAAHRLAAAALVALAGCDAGVLGLGGGDEPHDGKLSSNGLLLDVGALDQLDPGPLDGAWVGSLAATDSGLQHLQYLALCALDQGAQLTVTAPDGPHRFEGLYGLAPGWMAGTCDESCQRWITACLLAHANAYGESVTISMRGAHPGLVWGDAIAEEYVIQEAGFYGNAFAGIEPASGQRDLFACFGRSLISFDDDTDEPTQAARSKAYLQRRICGSGGACGIDALGPCVFPPIPEVSLCSTDAGWTGFYDDCHEEQPVVGQPPPEPDFPQVITTYLRP